MTLTTSSSSRLSPQIRRRVERFVRPLYTELDGVQTFPRVAELERSMERIAGPDAVFDRQYLELLVLLHGVLERLGSTAPESRFALFLKGLDLPQTVVEVLPAGLVRLEREPERVEEQLLHDALRLERTGVRAAAKRLMFLGKKRTPLEKVTRLLSPGPPLEGYRFDSARELARPKRRRALDWIAMIRSSLESPDETPR